MSRWARMVQGVMDLFGAQPAGIPATPAKGVGAQPQVARVPRVVSPRKKRGWSLVRKDGQWICLVPESLHQAPQEIQAQLDLWIRAALHPSPGSRLRRQQSQKAIFEWLEPHLVERIPPAKSAGQTWDLQELFQGLNRDYFEGKLESVLRWSPKWGGLSTHQTLRTAKGSIHLITIAQAYDAPDVPRYAVEGVLFHEMCHIAFPPRMGHGHKRVIHHREFRLAERRYAHWAQWRDWERTHLRKRVRRGHRRATGHL